MIDEMSSMILSTVTRMIEAGKFTLPNLEQACLFMMEEAGEVAGALVRLDNPEWVRNNPDKNPAARLQDVQDELADVIIMATLALFMCGSNAHNAVRQKLNKYLEKRGLNESI